MGSDLAPAVPPRRVRVSRVAFRVLAGALVVGVVLQVFLAGAALMSDASWWAYHTTFIHAVEAVPLLMLAAAVLGRGNRALVLGVFATSMLIGTQYALAGARPSLVAGLHVVNALVIFGLSLHFARLPASPGRESWARPAWR